MLGLSRLGIKIDVVGGASLKKNYDMKFHKERAFM